MRGACPSIFKFKGGFKSSLFIAGVMAWASIFNTGLAVYAQLPQTNMGQFVHQPGDNQYTSQTQSERHVPNMPMSIPAAAPMSPPMSSGASSASSEYKLTPSAPKPDISLLPIVADEPIKPAGFPPLPDRLDLPTSGTGIWSGGGSQRVNGVDGGPASGSGIDRNPSGVHQHYVHYQPGAFMPNNAMPQNNYRPSSTDYYNVNPAARTGIANTAVVAAPPAETPSTQALKRMGAEPQLGADTVTRPEAPLAVTVNQSVSQDLSLPEDDFNKHYPTNIGNSSANRAGRGIGQTLAYPARMLLYSGMGMASYGAMYAIRR